jgi:type II secretory pathway pseudopilin PulG
MRLTQRCNRVQRINPRGMGLIEIIVAIGISVITLTTAVSLSVRISIRAQENFVETSVLQYQALVSEELRLLEIGLKREVLLGNTFATGVFLPPASPTYLTWAKFCGNNPSDQYMSISLPSYKTAYAVDTMRLTSVTAGSNEVIDELVDTANGEDGRFRFGDLKDSNNQPISYTFGSFNSNDMRMEISLKKTVTSSAVFAGNADFNNITVKSVIRYNLYNKAYYTKPQEIRMVYNSVCPKS